MAGGWKYKLVLLVETTANAVVADASGDAPESILALSGDILTPTAEAIGDALAPTTQDTVTYGGWKYKLTLLDAPASVNIPSADSTGSAQSDVWELVASGVNASTYDDTRIVSSVKYEYRIVDATGAVLDSGVVQHPNPAFAVAISNADALSDIFAAQNSTSAPLADAIANAPANISTSNTTVNLNTEAYAVISDASADAVDPTADIAVTVGTPDVWDDGDNWDDGSNWGDTNGVANAVGYSDSVITVDTILTTVDAIVADSTGEAFAPLTTSISDTQVYADVADAVADAFAEILFNEQFFAIVADASGDALEPAVTDFQNAIQSFVSDAIGYALPVTIDTGGVASYALVSDAMAYASEPTIAQIRAASTGGWEYDGKLVSGGWYTDDTTTTSWSD